MAILPRQGYIYYLSHSFSSGLNRRQSARHMDFPIVLNTFCNILSQPTSKGPQFSPFPILSSQQPWEGGSAVKVRFEPRCFLIQVRHTIYALDLELDRDRLAPNFDKLFLFTPTPTTPCSGHLAHYKGIFPYKLSHLLITCACTLLDNCNPQRTLHM